MSASVEVTGVAELSSLFQNIQTATGNTSEVLDEAAAIMLNRIRGRFLETKAPDGSIWPVSKAALQRATNDGQKVGSKTYKDGKTLFMSGKLFQSIQARKPSATSRAIFTDKPYARSHNEGLNQVQRVFLGFSTDNVTILTRLAETRLDEALR